ncbi:MAG: thiamine pyrophosphate-dependent enzyme [Candidatus Hodarchaeota archaeon]
MEPSTRINIKTEEPNTWCPGCGNFGVLRALHNAIVDLALPREEIVLVTGIGCHGKTFNYVNVNGFHGIHGRVLPVMTGIKLSNHTLTVIGHAGDGDQYDEGLGHFPHAARRNVDVKLFTHDNKVYGLTTGQTSPTSIQGYVSKTTPHGAFPPHLEPLKVALASNASFVARGWVGDVEHLKELMKAAIQHEGFALVDILQVCITFNRVQTYQFYRDRVYKLDDQGHDTSDYYAAMQRAAEWGEKIPIGIFYQETRPVYRSSLPQIEKSPLVQQSLKTEGFTKFLKELT